MPQTVRVFIVAKQLQYGGQDFEVFTNQAGTDRYIRTGLTVKKGPQMDKTLRQLKQQWERSGNVVEVRIVEK